MNRKIYNSAINYIDSDKDDDARDIIQSLLDEIENLENQQGRDERELDNLNGQIADLIMENDDLRQQINDILD
jgi:chromosome segregation ATPase